MFAPLEESRNLADTQPEFPPVRNFHFHNQLWGERKFHQNTNSHQDNHEAIYIHIELWQFSYQNNSR